MSYGWWTILDTHVKLFSVKNQNKIKVYLSRAPNTTGVVLQ
jgi:hypothetical protein